MKYIFKGIQGITKELLKMSKMKIKDLEPI
jgi:hypothetical protein